MELRDYLHVLRRRWRVLACGLVVVVLAGLILTLRTTPQYESQAQVFISTRSNSSDAAYQGSLFSGQRVTSYADLVGGRDLAKRVIADLDLDLTPSELAAKVTAQAVPETVLLNIAVRDPDPREARRIAESYTHELGELVEDLETPPGRRHPVLKATTVESASLPTSPVEPNVPRNLGVAAVLGMLLGMGLALAREALDSSVKSADDVTDSAGSSVLAWIPHDPSMQKKPLVSDLGSHEPRLEAYRVLRTNLQFVEVDAANKAFVISSPVPGEGKSTTAVNVAISLAMAGERVLLVDGDLRRPTIAALLRLDQAIGLTSVLVGNVDVDVAIQRHSSGLDVLTSGSIPPNPAELLQSQVMVDLIAKLRGSYDVVIFDAPPLLPVTDAALLSSQTDGALLVVQFGKTTRDQLRGARERLAQVGAHPLGVVLNRVPRKRQTGYGYGYGYGDAPKPEPRKRAKLSKTSHRDRRPPGTPPSPSPQGSPYPPPAKLSGQNWPPARASGPDR